MIIAQISDTHIALDVPDADQRLRDFETVVADINSLDPQPDLIIHSGDIVHNGLAEEYVKAVEILSKAKAPVYAIVGNKDERSNMREAFSNFQFIDQSSEFTQFSIDDFPVKLVMLDTLTEESNQGAFCEDRLQFLDETLNDGGAKPVAVFMHHPPCEIHVGPNLTHFEYLEEMSALRKTLKQSGRVISIFSGHVHRSTNGAVDEIPVSVVTAVATPLRWGDYPEHMQTTPTYDIHRYDEKNGFVSETRIVFA